MDVNLDCVLVGGSQDCPRLVSNLKEMERRRRTQRLKTVKPPSKFNAQSTDPPPSTTVQAKTKITEQAEPSKIQNHHEEDDYVNNSVVSVTENPMRRILAPDFCQIDALELAPLLLGKYLRRDDVVLQITEVEAYRPNDSACHARVGITARTAPLFGAGGHAYVYLCYGIHNMLNIVADKEGVGAAVLIRSCAPISGLKTIQMRRGLETEKPILLTGPGKVGQALGLSTEWSNHPLFTPGGLELLDGPKPSKIVIGPRVGIDYASPEDVSALWRFAIADTPWVSAPRNTLFPPPPQTTSGKRLRMIAPNKQQTVIRKKRER